MSSNETVFGILRNTIAITATAAILAFSTSAHAVVIDFAQYANDNGEASVGEAKAASYANPLPTDANVPVAGLLLSATGGVPYLDASSGGKRGGLGVCDTTSSSAQCTPSSDDNVTSGEMITISLTGGRSFDFQVTEFRNGGHSDISTSTSNLFVEIGGGGQVETSFANEVATTYLDITSITFTFGGDSPDQFYISAVDLIYISAVDLTPETSVSEPGTLAIFGLGLAGLGYMRRRRAI